MSRERRLTEDKPQRAAGLTTTSRMPTRSTKETWRHDKNFFIRKETLPGLTKSTRRGNMRVARERDLGTQDQKTFPPRSAN
eukprot:2373957-Heterocapsa_arctica.AAC.1